MARARSLALYVISAATALGVCFTTAGSDQHAIARVVAVATGGAHSCATTEAGDIRCWGWNDNGELGDGSTASQRIAAAVPGISEPAVEVSAGWNHTCALTSTGGVKCWGANAAGQLGATSPDACGPFDCSTSALDVTGLTSGVESIAAGFSHTCAVTALGGLKCWGLNLYGNLGDGSTTDRHTPIDVAGLDEGVAAVAPGDVFTCALMVDSTVKCWGSNTVGELGNGTTANSSTAVDVCLDGACAQPLRDIVQIASGDFHSCALTSFGNVPCWGANDGHEMGTVSSEQCAAIVSQTCSTLPLPIPGLEHVIRIAAAGSHTCALTTEGAVQCWGRMFGSNNASWSVPTVIDGLQSGIASIAVGWDHMCAITTARELLCLGENADGQLGDGTTFTRSAPTRPWQLSNHGDADCDSAVTSRDATFVLQRVAALLDVLPCADIGAEAGQGAGARDALLILQYSVGLFG